MTESKVSGATPPTASETSTNETDLARLRWLAREMNRAQTDLSGPIYELCEELSSGRWNELGGFGNHQGHVVAGRFYVVLESLEQVCDLLGDLIDQTDDP